jgi:hypothetical protein
MIKLILIGFLSIPVISSLIVAGILLINLDGDKVSDGILYHISDFNWRENLCDRRYK